MQRARLRDHLAGSDDVFVVTTPGVSLAAVRHLRLRPAAEVIDITAPVPPPREHDTVVLAVRDLAALRRAVTGVANLGTAATVVVWFQGTVPRLPTIAPSPEWPALDAVVASRHGDTFVLFRFERPAPVRRVLIQVARAAAASGELHVGWPALGVPRDEPGRWPVADPSATIARPARLVDDTVDSPPDLLLVEADGADRARPSSDAHPVLARPTRVQVHESVPTWADLEARPDAALAGLSIDALRPVDEHLVNPIGFRAGPDHGVGALEGGPGDTFHVRGRGFAPVFVGSAGEVHESALPALRGLAGVRLDWSGGRGPVDYCRVVAGLAMAGIPLQAGPVPPWARRLLAPDLVAALSHRADLADELAREEHSVLARRAALRSHGARAWRRRLAAAHGLQPSAEPTVTVVLATRRPEMLPFALRQVARQRGVDLEVVLATHGFDADPAVLRSFADACAAPLHTFRADASVSFGEVLNLAARRASGDVLLKMDDDDWYAPDFVLDLLLARGYSGAQVVGCFAEFVFLEPLWTTTRRPKPSEVYTSHVAGGTMLIDRGAFRSLGGFRDTVKYVDANLLSAVIASGGTIYRTHGLGYVLRRGRHGHTWDPGLGYFLTGRRVSRQWRGFRPSRLVEADSGDHPDPPAFSG